ncbi:hypothetical protein [Aquirhabdus sp.]|uniref:hypothetical protein n=1 Tax=Aquirhabdus sp. TaxID=2824160 RepID=UPI00396C97DC
MSVIEIMSKLNAKTQNYRPSMGGKADIDWEDVCGALARLPPVAQDLAFLLHNPRAGREKPRMVALLAQQTRREVEKSGLKCRKIDLQALCEGIASIALYQVLYPNVCLTRADRMKAGGITMCESGYRARWELFETRLTDYLLAVQAEIESSMIDYLRKTKRELIVA